MRHWARFALVLAAAAAACAPPTPRTITEPDPEIACPAGRTSWALEVLDRRAEREGSEKLVSLLRDSITGSFPGCVWKEPGTGRPVVSIEIWRFRSDFDGSTSWEAVADWSVSVRDAAGRAVSVFESQADVLRPNYRGYNNERESLQEAFDRALRHTLRGLRAVSLAG